MSYVRYLSSTEVVSASTDSTLRLWNTQTLSQSRRFSGHVNEKNFVGLSVDSEFIACGSETDEVLLPGTVHLTPAFMGFPAFPPIYSHFLRSTVSKDHGAW